MAGLARANDPAALPDIDDDLRGRFLDPRRHVEVLAPMSVRHRRRGNARLAFAFADRFCRLTHHRDAFGLLLRAEASEDLGDFEGYRADVEASFRADPLLTGAARRKLAMTSSAARDDIARLILTNPRADRETRRDAIEAVLAKDYDIVSELHYDGHEIRGVLAWKDDGPVEYSFNPEPDAGWTLLWPGTIQRRGGREHAVAHISPRSTREPDDASGVMRAFRVRSGKGSLRRFDVTRFDMNPPLSKAAYRPISTSRSDTDITVIVPVFGHRRMTQLCLLALLRQKHEMPDLRILIVDDNPHRSVLTPAMAQAANTHGFEIVTNDANVGFARSVNRALEMVGSGDVLLLNADVLLPSGAIGRLAEASRTTTDIGTVTPFSNDGEEASFPSAFHPQPLLPFRFVRALDRAASTINGSDVVTIVNGIGFCLYITRQALDVVGRLPTAYERGYYEDVDFTLAVRKAGLRNVCATGVYVGHKGSGSFQSAKGGLVARNRQILFSRYPSYVGESAALVAADPLRRARAAIERAIEPIEPVASLLVLAAVAVGKATTYREATGEARCLYLTWSQDRTDRFILWMSDGSAPQSLHFEGADALDTVGDYLVKIGIAKAFIVGSAFEKQDLIRQLARSGIAIEMLFDESLVQVASRRQNADCEMIAGSSPCGTCIDAFSRAPVVGRNGASSGLDAALKVAQRIRPMNAMARAVAHRFRLETGEGDRKESRAVPVLGACAATTLGIITRVGDVAVEQLLHAIVRHALKPGARMVVFGPCLDACRLMSSPGVHVTGAVAEHELGRLLRAYAIDILFAASRWSGYGELERHGSGRPSAFFDWSGGLLRKHPRSLVLDPRICDRKVAHHIDEWWQGLRSSDEL